MKLTEKYLRKKYSRLVKFASYTEKLGLVEFANRFLLAASHLAYSFCLQYKDEVADKIISKISKRINRKECSQIPDTHSLRCVFFDSAAIYNGGLTNQYMEAIRDAGWEVLYLTDQDMTTSRRKDLRDLIQKNNRAQIVSVPRRYKGVKRLQFFYDQIISFGARNIFIHISPFAPSFIEVCAALPQYMNRFLINYTDSSFFLGINNADYYFEMSLPGCSISRKWRHISMEQQLFLPFYPFIESHQYQGLPSCCEGKKIILSGGNYWKIIDSEETYFKMCQRILSENPNAVILYPGMGDEKPVLEKVNKYNIADRFVLLGWRKDIAELFEHCDLHLATYPLFGGLMVLYAAQMKKPILNYSSQDRSYGPEDVVCQLKQVVFSKNSIDEVVNEAKKLLTDEEYRIAEGQKMYDCSVNREWFNEHFLQSVEKKVNCGPQIVIDDNIGVSIQKINDSIAYHSNSGVWKKRMMKYLEPLTIIAAPELTLDYIEFYCKSLKHAL